MNLAGARVLVVGLGVSGNGVVAALHDAGVSLSIAEDDPGQRELAGALDGITEIGTTRELIRGDYDLIVVSPGLSPERIGLEPQGGAVIGELELGWLLADAPISAITGTNGKTTVATLTSLMLGPEARLCGNAGVSFAAVARSGASSYVVEASSFQLTWAPTFSPACASWTNFTPDHLDWHGDLDRYRRAKAKLFEQLSSGQVAILNADDPVVNKTALPEGVVRRTFSLRGPADYRVVGDAFVGPDDVELMPVHSLVRHGPIDLANALLSWATAETMGADREMIRVVLEQFRGLKHRQERVGKIRGVLYVNDSKATTPVAAAAGVASFEHVVLIAGGRGKGLSFAPLLEVSTHLRAVITIGECAFEIEELFAETEIPVRRAASMGEAVGFASAKAGPGDVVLLSPGAASFDWYRSYAERGSDFASLVRALEQSGASSTTTDNPVGRGKP